MLRGLSIAGLVVVVLGWLAPTAFGDERELPPLNKLIEIYQSKGMLSGTLLVKKGGRERLYSFDYANDETKEKNTRDTVFLIASVSKSFVAASILKLADRGKLKLEDPISLHLTELPKSVLEYSGKPVTIHHLLGHTSGIPDVYYYAPVENKIDRMPVEFADFTKGLEGKKHYFEPGKSFKYSNSGYVLLGEIISRVAGEPYPTFLKREILDPLGLRNTSVGLPDQSGISVARSYIFDPLWREDYQKTHKFKSLGTDKVLTDLNIRTSVDDLARFTEHTTSGKVVSAESTKAMLTGRLDNYGYGWVIKKDSEGRLYYRHGGDYDGYQSSVTRYPAEDLTVVWLSNQYFANFEMLAKFASRVVAASLKENF